MSAVNAIKRTLWLFGLLLFVIPSSLASPGNPETATTGTDNNTSPSRQVLLDRSLWHPVQNSTLNTWLNGKIASPVTQPAVNSLIGRSGQFVAQIATGPNLSDFPYVVVNSNFVDTGRAFWQADGQAPQPIADFSVSSPLTAPFLAHAHTFRVDPGLPQAGTLWIVIDAEHYTTPVTVSVYSAESYFRHQQWVNFTTLGAVFTLLTMAILAMVVFWRTCQPVTFWYAGYVGLHSAGWAMSAGLINALGPWQVNTGYGGMYLFPAAIACAAMFTAGLFSLRKHNPRLHRVMMAVAVVGAVSSPLLLVLPFTPVFYFAHLMASIWVGCSLAVALANLRRYGVRAWYYFIGNLLYSASLVYYMASHALPEAGFYYPEMTVLIALSLDCLCILLALAEWLRAKQLELGTVTRQAHIDRLTGAGNRFALDEHMAKLDRRYLIVFIDFDGMKGINDQLGHSEGDRFLIEAVKELHQHLPNDGQLFRVGGDEFVWLRSRVRADNTELEQQINHCITDIEARLQRQWPMAGISYGLGYGVSSSDKHQSMAEADRRMYEHKTSKQSIQVRREEDGHGGGSIPPNLPKSPRLGLY